MSEGAVIKICELGGGVTATVKDLTRHYFGGYYHVRILVSADVPVSASLFDLVSDFEDASLRLGGMVTFSRILEKMAVPEGEIEVVRQHLMDAFDTNVLPYLQRDDFASGFVRSEHRKKLKSVPNFPGKYA